MAQTLLCAVPGNMATLPEPTTARHMALAPDIGRVIAARRLMMRKVAPRDDADYGRAAQSAWIANYTNPVSADVDIRQTDRWTHVLTPANAQNCTLHYIHGGGLVYYDALDFLPMLTRLAAGSGARIMVHGYAKMPENTADTCLSPLIARIMSALNPDGRDIVIGDSIGGLVALHIAAGPVRDRVQGAVLVYPVLSLSTIFPSYSDFATGLFLDAEVMLWFRRLWADWFVQHGTDPLAMARLPCPVTIFAAPCDILADEARAFAQCHPKADLHWLQGQGHDALLYAGRVQSADVALTQVAEHLKTLVKGNDK
ncbi:alpha/beta hydrolase fold domain-containing protein [Puniceibacterium sediminis]|uniref:Acetyl esterase/lipase n=1 Tax=Puniceibacterium sediminis TaxID=1608407 RepID=A0A238YTM2_9RHOB|nr:alpha/beta hydrolase fold domain-containing protein [Puniceibacterium sediminis]SNR74495.1 Acetyl esterase/lipase [Puniceibacterium sediminis]